MRRGIPEGGKPPAGKAAPKGATGTKPPAKAVPNKSAGKHICGLIAARCSGLPPVRPVSLRSAGHNVLVPSRAA